MSHTPKPLTSIDLMTKSERIVPMPDVDRVVAANFLRYARNNGCTIHRTNFNYGLRRYDFEIDKSIGVTIRIS